MKILHTSDWHLGRSLYGRKRYDEFAAFLNWLLDTIESENVAILLVAGDIFDTNTPSNKAQQLYYRFLWRVSQSCCRHVVVIAGNHDSPSFLNAPKPLLAALNVHVVGAITSDPADEVIVLYNNQIPEAIICAVPYLRDKDIRTVAAGETIDDKNKKLIDGVRQHYAKVSHIAQQKRLDFIAKGKVNMPIIAMGHLFTAGGKTLVDDGVRELYVGSLAYVGADVFPAVLDYVALGHLHVPQKVGGMEHIRYCGSPIPMGFGEANQRKQVNLLTFINNEPIISVLEVPCFQRLVRIEGNLEHIESKIQALKQEKSQAWLEIEYTGDDMVSHLNEWVIAILQDTQMEVRRIKDQRVYYNAMQTKNNNENLEDLNVSEVFSRCLDAFDISAQDRDELIIAYNEVLTSLYEQDSRAE